MKFYKIDFMRFKIKILYLCIFIGTNTLLADIIYVDDNASVGGDGVIWATAKKYLQDALADAKSGDEIWVAEGIYKPDQGVGQNWGDRNATFSLKNGVKKYKLLKIESCK